MFGKNKKHNDLEAKREQELQNQRLKEDLERKEQLQKQIEEAEKMAAEAMKNNTPYRFSVPDPMPKELVSVLKEMFKKLFPDAKKAYLVYTQYEEKAGYLLVVDIDPKFHKIINLYLDGETKKVRNGLPIECILYAKSGALTEGMEPFYQKEIIDTPNISGAFVDLAALGISADFSLDDVFDFESGYVKHESDEEEKVSEEISDDEDVSDDEALSDDEPLPDEDNADKESIPDEEVIADEESDLDEEIEAEEIAADDIVSEATNEDNEETEFEEPSLAEEECNDEHGEDEIKEIEFKIEEAPVKVKPETKQQLFALMNRASKNDSEEVLSVAIAGFGEFEFYIPYISAEDTSEGFQISASCPDKAQHIHLINCDSGIKATALFTDEENAVAFAKTQKCGLVKMKYSDYKLALNDGAIVASDVEGVIINPDVEEILLPSDYPLL